MPFPRSQPSGLAVKAGTTPTSLPSDSLNQAPSPPPGIRANLGVPVAVGFGPVGAVCRWASQAGPWASEPARNRPQSVFAPDTITVPTPDGVAIVAPLTVLVTVEGPTETGPSPEQTSVRTCVEPP
jgi:hypothetical protein